MDTVALQVVISVKYACIHYLGLTLSSLTPKAPSLLATVCIFSYFTYHASLHESSSPRPCINLSRQSICVRLLEKTAFILTSTIAHNSTLSPLVYRVTIDTCAIEPV